ncbi:AAA family ATPase [Microlunatus elymi]|uniref:AAA family ATPase n=1 Tax=Microlunatus elymi TaxID=2596828 RepID=A0A516Q394_9ACTN|nr:LuxR family transcriptional regulator [Microlunatus elymi]QDP97862.1 AAA family ATPase [Microlunatus elymi]
MSPTNDTDPGHSLRGRRREREALARLVEKARAGQSEVLVVRGAAGIGKTALLEFLADRAAECHLARAAGVQAEMELPYAGLHQLCGPFLGPIAELPPPQRDALETSFGIKLGPPPDRFLVGLATLSLLAEVAGERPLICLIDDVQWWDRSSVQVLAFVARRLLAEPIVLVFATREEDDSDFRGLPELRLQGLDTFDAGALLDSIIPGRIDAHVRSRIIAETGGNPLALIELPSRLDPRLTGGFAIPSPRPITEQLQDSYARRIAALPEPTRQLLQIAAVEPTGDAALLWRAVDLLGIDADAALPAESAGLISIGNRVRFRHPLLRATVHAAATAQDRQRAHQALAEAIDADLDPDRRAWHRALAARTADEEVAAELQSSADRARQRGGVAAEAALLERAVQLTPEPRRRGERALAAAGAKLRAGAVDETLSLLAIAETSPLSDSDRAKAALVRAQSRFVADRGRDAVPLLLQAARRLEPIDPRLAMDTFLEAISAAMFAGRLAGSPNVAQVARDARSGTVSRSRDSLGDQLLRALTARFSDGYRASIDSVRAMLQAICDGELTAGQLRYLWLAAATAADVWDGESWQRLATEHVRIARETGSLTELPLALNSRAVVHLFAGEGDAAASLVAEIPNVTASTGTHVAAYAAMALAAWRGDAGSARTLIETNLADVRARGEGVGVAMSYWAEALLELGLGNYEAALSAATDAASYPDELAVPKWAMSEMIEAAAGAGHRDLAFEVLERLAEFATVSGTDWALGVEARGRALLAGDSAADNAFRESIGRLGTTRMVAELARSRLLYGEWLHRGGRRAEARTELTTAHELFTTMGAVGFAQRARRTLRAVGVTVQAQSLDAAATLTGQEAQIARLASDGLTNPEIGAQLFLSPHTVEWHLRKVYNKLGVRSRKRLADKLPARSTN